MALIKLTVSEYLAATMPFPAGTTVSIVDTGANIGDMTIGQLTALSGNGVVSLNATDNDLPLSYAQINALGNVAFSVDDRVKWTDGVAVISALPYMQLKQLAAKGVDVIDVIDLSGGNLHVSETWARELANTSLSFDDSDMVTIDAGNFFTITAAEIPIFEAKGIDAIAMASSGTYMRIDAAKALIDSKIKFSGDDILYIQDTEEVLAQLQASDIAKLVNKGIDKFISMSARLSWSLDQVNAMGAATFMAEDKVTLALDLVDLATLSDAQIANFHAKNIDDVSLTVQLSDLAMMSDTQIAAIRGRGIDSLVLKEAGQTIASLDAYRIAGLAARGVDKLDAIDDKLDLSLSQFRALGTLKLTSDDYVVFADSIAAIFSMNNDEVLSLSDKGIDRFVIKDAGKNISALTAEQLMTLFKDWGIRGLNATDNAFTFNQSQYNALSKDGLSVELSADDVVTVQADADITLSNGGTNLILTGNAIRGTANNLSNTLTGNAKNNILSGLDGNDKIDGGYGKDVLTGGAGNDTFIFKDPLSRTANYDTITDYNKTYDTIQLDNKYFTKLGSGSASAPKKLNSKYFNLGSKPKDKYDYLNYNIKTGVLTYDADGSDSKYKPIEIIKFSNKAALNYAEFYII